MTLRSASSWLLPAGICSIKRSGLTFRQNGGDLAQDTIPQLARWQREQLRPGCFGIDAGQFLQRRHYSVGLARRLGKLVRESDGVCRLARSPPGDCRAQGVIAILIDGQRKCALRSGSTIPLRPRGEDPVERRSSLPFTLVVANETERRLRIGLREPAGDAFDEAALLRAHGLRERPRDGGFRLRP